MADSSVLLEVIVEGKNIKLVQRQVEELGAAINNSAAQQEMADKKDNDAQKSRNKNARETYNNQRAIINGSLAAGRANAKLASGITGGLVPAYAEIVSNIFAVQQAFSLLQRSQDLVILRENLIKTGIAAGRDLPAVAEGLVEITDAALSAKDALEATANATAQGFSTSQLESLTRVAKGASAALGRNLTDSLDRLVRGTAKLEPEILDELGIIVRLDDATREYAAALGKTASELTQFERQQAFLTAAITQGEKKFGDIADSTQANSYDQLAATFSDLAQALVELANVAIVPVAKFLSQNTFALTGALLLFAQTIGNRLSPALSAMSEEADNSLKVLQGSLEEAGSKLSKELVGNIETLKDTSGDLPKGVEEFKESLADGTVDSEKLAKAQNSIAISIGRRRGALESLEGVEREAAEANITRLEETKGVLDSISDITQSEQPANLFDSTAIEGQISQVDAYKNSLNQLESARNPLEQIQAAFSGIGDQFNATVDGLNNLDTAYQDSGDQVGRFALNNERLSLILGGVGRSARLAGKAILTMLPYIGLAFAAAEQAVKAFSSLIEFFDKTSERAKKVAESFSNLAEVGEEVAVKLALIEDPDSSEALNTKLEARVGILERLATGLDSLNRMGDTDKARLKQEAEFLQNQEAGLRAELDLIRARRIEGKEATANQLARVKGFQMNIASTRNFMELLKQRNQLTKTDVQVTLGSYLAEINASKELQDILGDRIELIREYQREAEGDPSEEVLKGIIESSKELFFTAQATQKAVEGIGEAFSNLDKVNAEIIRKQDTALTDQVKGVQELANLLNVVADSRDGLNLLAPEDKKRLELFSNSLRAVYGDQLDTSKDNKELVLDGLKLLKAQEEVLRTAAANQKRLTNQAKEYASVAKNSVVFTEMAAAKSNDAIDQSIEKERVLADSRRLAAQNAVEQAVAAFNDQKGKAQKLFESDEAYAARRLALARAVDEARERSAEVAQENEARILELEESKVDATQLTLDKEQARIARAQELLGLKQKDQELDQKSLGLVTKILESTQALTRARTGSDVNVQDQLAAAIAEDALLTNGENERIAARKEAIGLEYDLLRAQIAFQRSRTQETLDAIPTTPNGQRTGPDAARASALQAQLDSLDEQSTTIGTIETKAKGLVDAESAVGAQLRTNNIELLTEQARRAVINAQLKEKELTANRINALISESTVNTAEEANIQSRINQLNEDLTTLKSENTMAEGENLAILQKSNELEEAKLELLEKQFENRKKQMDAEFEFQNSAIAGLKRRVELEQEIASVERSIKAQSGIEEFAGLRFKREAEERKARLSVAKAERDIKLAMIDAEFGLLKAKQAQLKAELSADGLTAEEQAIIDANQEVLNRQEQLNGILKGNIQKEFELLTKKEKLEQLRSINAAAEAAAKTSGVGGGIAAAFEGIRQLFEPPKEEKKSEIDKELDKVFKDTKITEENKTEALIATVAKTGTATANAIQEGMKSVGETVNKALATLTVNTINASVLNAQTVNKGAGAATQGTGSTVVDAANDAGEEMPNAADTANAEATTPPSAPVNTEAPAVNTESIPTTAIPDASADAGEGGEGEGTPSPVSKILTGARAAADSFAETMKQFGPEGEAMGQFLSGGVALGESLMSTMENFKEAETGAEKTKAVLGGIGSALGAIGQMQQAAAAGKVAAIDKEIAAERKRDGKSKESVAKIKQMEAKKEAIQRKAFEQNKKIQLAQAVVNGLSAIQSGFATQPFFPVGIAMGALAIAMTAMQIKAIQSQQYNGGASSSSSSAPTSISLGKRKESSDLSKTQSVSGELAYMRGDKGMGGPEKFQPAFMGAKYRAMGGPTTGYVVGEQGPELFVPETPGTIVPNDEAGFGNNGSTAVTFNINTIDASGVEDMLVAQSGNIVGMIRSAANQYGQPFLEEVEVSAFTQQAGGVTKY